MRNETNHERLKPASSNGTHDCANVRTANADDIKIIEAWLPVGHEVESMAVNWNLALEEYEKDRLLVWDELAGDPVAYFWGRLTSTSCVLEVRPDRRGRGVGKAFVSHLIDLARTSGDMLLKVECAPPSSAPFWSAMGFSVTIEDGRRHIGRRVLECHQTLPPGSTIPVSITFFRMSYNNGGNMPVARHHLLGAIDDVGILRLNEKVACFKLHGSHDLGVQIDVDGKTLFCDDVRYAESQQIGLMRCTNGYAIGSIVAPTRPEAGLTKEHSRTF